MSLGKKSTIHYDGTCGTHLMDGHRAVCWRKASVKKVRQQTSRPPDISMSVGLIIIFRWPVVVEVVEAKVVVELINVDAVLAAGDDDDDASATVSTSIHSFIRSEDIFTVRLRTHTHGLAIDICPSVCPSVRLSVCLSNAWIVTKRDTFRKYMNTTR